MGQTHKYDYSAERRSADISLADYIDGYRDAARFLALCRECPAFGRTWVCPPLEFDADALLARFSTVHIVGTKITPAEAGLPLSCAEQLIAPERLRLEADLLKLERAVGGLAAVGIGRCRLCPQGCTRPQGLPCRHPERVRRSLEAYGFDLGRTASQLLGLEMLWGADGCLPPYLLIVGAVFE
ncbi:MAG: DUF2284 domain-containing protein [Muribaculaceae bacterium]|nr:DUF2284 domain-containing protein [Muribaculaceae bacterium]